jgi:DNA polymerase-4
MGAILIDASPVGKFHGIGPVTAEKMNQLGLFTGLI